MQLDTRSILTGLSPVEQPTAMLNRITESQANLDKYKEYQEAAGQKRRLQDLAKSSVDAGGNFDQAGFMKGYMQEDPIAAMNYQSKLAKTATETQKTKLDTALKQTELFSKLLNSAVDQPSYDRAKKIAQSVSGEAGGDLSYLPDVYDPKAIEQMKMNTIGVKDQLSLKMQQERLNHDKASSDRNYNLNQGKFAYDMIKPTPGYGLKDNPDGTYSYFPIQGGPADPKYLREKSEAVTMGKGAFSEEDPITGKITKIYRPLGGENQGNGMTTGSNAQVEQGLMSNLKSLSALSDIQKTYKSEYLRYTGKGYASVAAELGKMGLSTEQQDTYLADYDRFHSNVKELFNQYRKEITGAGAALGELKDLEEAFLNGNLPPAQFVSRMQNIQYKAAKAAALNQKFLNEGLRGKQLSTKLDDALKGTPSTDEGKAAELLNIGYTPDEVIELMSGIHGWDI